MCPCIICSFENNVSVQKNLFLRRLGKVRKYHFFLQSCLTFEKTLDVEEGVSSCVHMQPCGRHGPKRISGTSSTARPRSIFLGSRCMYFTCLIPSIGKNWKRCGMVSMCQGLRKHLNLTVLRRGQASLIPCFEV